MVEPPALVERHRRRRQQFPNALRQLRVARRRVLNAVKFAREPSEIVNRFRRRGNRDAGLRHKPMRRNREDRLWPGDGAAKFRPGLGIAIAAQSIHRITMPEEDCRKEVGHAFYFRW